MNIIYEDKKIRFVNNTSDSYSIVDLRFYIPEELRSDEIYISLRKIVNDAADSLKLKRIDNHNGYDVYIVDVKQDCSLTDSMCGVRIMFADLINCTVEFSDEFELNLQFGHFDSANGLYEYEEVMNEINKIYEMIAKINATDTEVEGEVGS